MHWWAWGPEALAEAKRTGKPILLSVGYAACHWCHVMAHESFEDDATAEVMNDLFVNIKVDREERPDVDAIYMAALHELGEHGGWPLTMFLTVRRRAVLGRHLFPQQGALWPAGLRRCAAPGRARLSRRAGRGAQQCRCAARAARAEARSRQGRRCRVTPRSPISRSVSPRSSTPSMAASKARRNSRSRSSSIISGAEASATVSTCRRPRWR